MALDGLHISVGISTGARIIDLSMPSTPPLINQNMNDVLNGHYLDLKPGVKLQQIPGVGFIPTGEQLTAKLPNGSAMTLRLERQGNDIRDNYNGVSLPSHYLIDLCNLGFTVPDFIYVCQRISLSPIISQRLSPRKVYEDLLGMTYSEQPLKVLSPEEQQQYEEAYKKKEEEKRLENEEKEKKKAEEEKKKFETAFAKVILPEKTKKEIIAVLNQSKNAKQIFEDWGLGETIEYGRGMTMLFHGGPGTGKTWTANCIAKALKRELLTVGPAEIQSSEPGGANRAIQEAFQNCKSSNKVLLLDECDSLITVRSSVGIILGGEINTLLTEIEKFEGVCILSTNRADTLDPALERRLALIVQFDNPDYEARKRIWEVLIPKKLPLEKEVTLDWLAEYKLTGGQIKNVLLQAARSASADEQKEVKKGHVENAVSWLLKSANLLGSGSTWNQTIRVKQDLQRS